MMEGQFHSLIDIFKTGKEQYPEKTAIIMGEDTRTYGQIFDNAKRIAGFVLEKEIKPQDKVAVISQNHVDYIETVLGIIMAGGVPVNINWRLAAPELHHLLQFLLLVILHKGEVVFAVVRNGSIQILANGHAPWLLSHQLEVDTQFCVWVESLSCFT